MVSLFGSNLYGRIFRQKYSRYLKVIIMSLLMLTFCTIFLNFVIDVIFGNIQAGNISFPLEKFTE